MATDNSALIAGAQADFSERDPEFIRRQLPLLWLLSTLYFRAEVTGMEKVPDGPVLFVGNHNGGSMPLDVPIFLLAFNTYYSVDRPLYALAHAMLTSAPGIGALARRFGVITAGPEAARQAFDQGASLLVYPGGDVEVMRPWTRRFEIDFDGRKGFLKLAWDAGVPIVPVVTDGMHDSLIVLTDGRKLAKALRLDKLGRIKVLPIALAAPFGITVGDLFHVPFPVKVRTNVLDPIDLRQKYGDDIDYDHAYDYVTSTMQVGLKTLATKRTLPI